MGDKRSFLASARLIGAATLLSRILGMARDVLASHYFGAGAVWDAFQLAYRVPNLFRRLFGEGALTAAFVPAFVERLETGRRAEAELLFRRLTTALTLLLVALTIVGVAVTWILPGDPQSQRVAEYARIMLPYLPLVCVTAILGGALNGLRHFFAPAIAPVLMNVVLIGAILATARASREEAGRWQSWAVTAGGGVQLLIVVAALASKGIRPLPEFSLGDPALREVGGRFAPMVLGLSLVQVNEFMNSLIAQLCVPGAGAVSALSYSNLLVQLPLSLIGTSVATAVFPAMSSAVAGKRGGEFADLTRRALGSTLFLSVPATAGLIVFAAPIVRVIYEHGRFGPEDTARTATALICYAGSLWCYCANLVQVRAFYALGDTRTPVRVSVAMIALGLALNLTLVWPLREAGIALGTSISGLCSFVTLQILLRRRSPELGGGAVLGAAVRALAGSGVMAVAAYPVWLYLPSPEGLPGRGVRLGAAVAVALAVYFGAARLMRRREGGTS